MGSAVGAKHAEYMTPKTARKLTCACSTALTANLDSDTDSSARQRQPTAECEHALFFDLQPHEQRGFNVLVQAFEEHTSMRFSALFGSKRWVDIVLVYVWRVGLDRRAGTMENKTTPVVASV